MRAIFLLGLGLISGVVATVMFFTLTDLPGEDAVIHAGGGNARLSLDDDALSKLYEDVLRPALEPDAAISVATMVEDDGLIRVTVLVGPLGVEDEARLVLDPEVVDGELSIAVVESVGDMAGGPIAMTSRLEGRLRSQLAALAGGLPYRLVSITTRDGQLTLEIAI